MIKIIRLKEVLEIVPLSKSSIYSKIAKGEFPSSIPLGERAVGWLQSDIDNWIISKAGGKNLASVTECCKP